MTLSIHPRLTIGIAILGAGAIVAVSPPVALADGGLGGGGTGTVTGPGGTTLGTATSQVTGAENVPGGAPGIPGCVTGGCSGSLSSSTGIVTGPGGTPPPTGLQITPTINLPQPNAIACITAQCHGGGSLSGSGSVQTPIVGVSGGLNGYIHG